MRAPPRRDRPDLRLLLITRIAYDLRVRSRGWPLLFLTLGGACTPLRPLDPMDESDASRTHDARVSMDAALDDAVVADAGPPGDAASVGDGSVGDARLLDAANGLDAPPDAYTDPDAGSGCVASARGLSCTSPGVRSFTIPPGVTRLSVSASGAGGGGYDGTEDHVGGDGSTVESTVSVSPGALVWLVVGGGGGGGRSTCSPATSGGGGGLSGVIGVGGEALVVAAGGGGASIRGDGCDADSTCSTATDDRAPGDGFGGGGGGALGAGGMGAGAPTFAGGTSPCAGAAGGVGGGGGGGASLMLGGGGGGGGSGWPGGRGGRSNFNSQPGHGGQSAVSDAMIARTPGPAGGAPGLSGEDGALTLSW